MAFIEWAILTAVLIAVIIVCRLLWAWLRLKSHAHVEPVEVADPSIASELNQLVEQIARQAGVAPPPLFIRRAALPNAFVVATMLRPELYLTDELLEQCNASTNPLEMLTRVLSHEISHIRRGDALRLGLLAWLSQIFTGAGLRRLAARCTQSIENIEHLTDVEADQLMQQLVGQDNEARDRV